MKNNLRNMFYYALPNNGSQVGINSTTRRMEEAERCEKIADEFAIGFADWIRVCKLKGRPYDFDNTKELLEIYKDEKDL
jgi:hypothetical protein